MAIPDGPRAVPRLLEYPALLPIGLRSIGEEGKATVLARGTSAAYEALHFDQPLAVPQAEEVSQSDIDCLTLELRALKISHAEQLEKVAERERESGYAAAKREDSAALQGKLERLGGATAAIELAAHDYLLLVEREVVALALDIAYRVMKHEAQMDPLFLRGAVHSALEAIGEGGEIRLVVPAEEVAAWRAEMTTVVLAKKRVVVEADRTLSAGECLCRLTTGTLDLSVASQLGEVERSFESVLRRRGAAAGSLRPTNSASDATERAEPEAASMAGMCAAGPNPGQANTSPDEASAERANQDQAAQETTSPEHAVKDTAVVTADTGGDKTSPSARKQAPLV